MPASRKALTFEAAEQVCALHGAKAGKEWLSLAMAEMLPAMGDGPLPDEQPAAGR